MAQYPRSPGCSNATIVTDTGETTAAIDQVRVRCERRGDLHLPGPDVASAIAWSRRSHRGPLMIKPAAENKPALTRANGQRGVTVIWYEPAVAAGLATTRARRRWPAGSGTGSVVVAPASGNGVTVAAARPAGS